MGPIEAVDHLVIGVDDLERATDDYRLLFGLEPSWHGHHPSLGTRNTLFRLANVYVELLSGSGTSHPFAGSGTGLAAIAFQVSDIDAASASLSGLGATPPVDGEGEDASSGAMRRWRTSFLDMNQTRGVFLFLISHLSEPDALPLAIAKEGTASPVRSVDHVVIATADADGAVSLYGDRLGLDLRLDRTVEEFGARLCFFRVGDMIVEVAQGLSEVGDPGSDHLWGISYRVEDIYAAHDRCDRAGIEVSEVRPGRRKGTKVFTVRSHTHGVATLFLAKDQA